MKWLITGGCGFIGTSLIRALQAHGGHQIRVLDNLSTGTREDLALVSPFEEKKSEELGESPGQLELLVGDILDEPLTHIAAKGMDVIVHLGG